MHANFFGKKLSPKLSKKVGPAWNYHTDIFYDFTAKYKIN